MVTVLSIYHSSSFFITTLALPSIFMDSHFSFNVPDMPVPNMTYSRVSLKQGVWPLYLRIIWELMENKDLWALPSMKNQNPWG